MGLTALEILDRLNKRWWNGELERTSLSPQITRLTEPSARLGDLRVRVATELTVFGVGDRPQPEVDEEPCRLGRVDGELLGEADDLGVLAERLVQFNPSHLW